MRTKLVRKMAEKFGIPQQHHTDHDFILFRANAMLEEITEFISAVMKDDKPEMLDALVDLGVFLDGTVDLLGFGDVYDEAYARVMKANMGKELSGTSSASKRGWSVDLRKPEGWVAPDLSDLV